MANLTRKAVLTTFDEMASEMPFDKITVSALVARTGISSNTFYYHYRDIYDLLEQYLLWHMEKALPPEPDWNQWTGLVKSLLYYLKDHRKQVNHIMDSISRQRLERFVFTRIQPKFLTIARAITNEGDLSEDQIRVIAKIYCYTFLGFLLEFLWNHMEDDVEVSVGLLADAFADMAKSYIGRHASQIR